MALTTISADYARAHDGRFWRFGSTARRTMEYDSDVDPLLHFPGEVLTEAWTFAETACCD